MSHQRLVSGPGGDAVQRLPEAEAAFAAQAVGYTHIPVPFAAPEESHYAAFVEAVGGEAASFHLTIVNALHPEGPEWAPPAAPPV